MQSFDKLVAMIDASKIIDKDAKDKLQLIIEELADYADIFTGIAISRPQNLIPAILKIDKTDMMGALSGTTLALACVLDYRKA